MYSEAFHKNSKANMLFVMSSEEARKACQVLGTVAKVS